MDLQSASHRHIFTTTTLIHAFIHSAETDRASAVCQALGWPRVCVENKADRVPALVELRATVSSPSLHQQQLWVKKEPGASLVVQWLRICLPMQGTPVRALVWEDPTCRGATRPVRHNY